MHTKSKITNSIISQEQIFLQQTPKFLIQAEAAAILRKPERWLERKRWEGGGPAFRHIGRTPVYELSHLLAWIDDQAVTNNTTIKH